MVSSGLHFKKIVLLIVVLRIHSKGTWVKARRQLSGFARIQANDNGGLD